MTKLERGFEHWRIFLHNYKGPDFSPWITQPGSLESEDVSVAYLCWLFSIGNSYSTMRGKFSAIRFLYVPHQLGNPFYKMELLKKFMNANLRVTGGSVGSMRASVEFLSVMVRRLVQEGGLLNLAIASAAVSGWAFIFFIQNYVAWSQGNWTGA